MSYSGRKLNDYMAGFSVDKYNQKQILQVENPNRNELKRRMIDMSTFLKKQSTALAKYDEQLVRWLIEKVTSTEANKLPQTNSL